MNAHTMCHVVGCVIRTGLDMTCASVRAEVASSFSVSVLCPCTCVIYVLAFNIPNEHCSVANRTHQHIH